MADETKTRIEVITTFYGDVKISLISKDFTARKIMTVVETRKLIEKLEASIEAAEEWVDESKS